MESSKKPELATAVAHVEFQQPEHASQSLERISARIPAGVANLLPNLLAELPDPDSALNLFERLVETGGGELMRLLDRHRFLVHYALIIFGYSQFLGDTLIRNPDLLHSLLRERNLDRSFSREEFHESLARFRARSLESDVSLLLARFKRREYVRIMLRDVLGIAPLAETTAEISALADVLIGETLREAESVLHRRYGLPQHTDAEGRVLQTPFAVLSLGKLGGSELNYSSDVDLMYIFGDGDEPASASISNREYFVRLAQRVTESLSRITAEGRVFRIDLRLRPQGGEGEPAIALSQALHYYAHTAQDWERQALIKVRYSAGDPTLARQFIRVVQPRIYSERVNFKAIETALDTRERISAHRRRAWRDLDRIDVKLDRGGIRDIEFLVQCLQRVYGGAEPWLRSRGTLFSLQKLHDKGHISGKEFHELTGAYEFLRKLEHRLQLRHGQQTHKLPEAEEQLHILYRSVAADHTQRYSPEGIRHAVRQCMISVAEIYERIIHHQQLQSSREGEREFHLQPTIEEIGPEQAYHQLLQRLAEDSPPLYELAMRPDLETVTRRNLYRFLSSAFTSSERYTAVLHASPAVEQALKLFAYSDFLTGILVRHPEEIETLSGIVQHRSGGNLPRLFEGAGPSAVSSNDPVFEYLASSATPYGEKLALLRRHFRHRTFASGATDLLETRPVHDSMHATTSAADEAVRAAYAIAGRPGGLAVLALGRLGTYEFDVLSDGDLLFIREEAFDSEQARRAAEMMVHALAAYTRDGTVFPVDTRLRPHGGEGDLVATPAQLQMYFAQEAHAWEALSFPKLRFLAGSWKAANDALVSTRRLFERFAEDAQFANAVRDMRSRLKESEPGEGNFKTGPGAVYDIDFIASYLFIRHEITEASGNLRDRLLRLKERSALTSQDWSALNDSAEFFRAVEHVVRLVVGKARKSLPESEHARRATDRLTVRILGHEFAGGVESELTRRFAQVREIYDRVLR